VSQLLQGLKSPIYYLNGIDPPNYFHNGLPFDSAGGLAVDQINNIDHYHQGLPVTVQGRLVVISSVIPTRISPGGAPFNAADRLCFIDNVTIDHVSAGVGYSADNQLSFTTTP